MNATKTHAPTALTALDTIYTRRSVRQYRDQALDRETIRGLIDAAIQAPTAMHVEPWAFAVVQDRVTAAGARRYVALQRDALAGRGPSVTIDQIMRPAIRRSVQQGLLWGGVVLVLGLGVAGAVGRRRS